MLVREPRIQPPSLAGYSDVPLFNTKAVVHQTGVPAPTLRAWERRYGILTPLRGDNDYRLYSERDIATVTWLRQRVENGMTISQAIALLHSMEPSRRKGQQGNGRSGATATPESNGAVARTAAEPERFDLAEFSATLLGHFARLDEDAAKRLIGQALSAHSLEDVCLSLFTPTLIRVGELWASGEMSTAMEHFAAGVIRAQLDSLFRSAATGDDAGPLALVGCAPGELHELGALMLALFLRRSGLRVAYLGQNLETDGLIATIRAARPAVVLLSVSLPANLGGLRDVGLRLHDLGDTQPTLIFGGQLFTQKPNLARGIPGEFLNIDAGEAAREVRRRLSA